MPALFRKVALENLDSSEHLDHFMQVTTPSRWLLAVGFLLVFGAMAIWGFYGTTRTFAEGSGWVLKGHGETKVTSARIFLPAQTSGNLYKGLPVWLQSPGFPAEHYGYLIGEVNAVQLLTADERASLPELASLTHQFPPENDLFEVRVLLKRAEDGTIGAWTLRQSQGMLPRPKTPIEAKIILAELRPVDLLWQSRFEAD